MRMSRGIARENCVFATLAESCQRDAHFLVSVTLDTLTSLGETTHWPSEDLGRRRQEQLQSRTGSDDRVALDDAW